MVENLQTTCNLGNIIARDVCRKSVLPCSGGRWNVNVAQTTTQKTHLLRKVHRKQVKSRFDLMFACLARYDQVVFNFRFHYNSYASMSSFKVNLSRFFIKAVVFRKHWTWKSYKILRHAKTFPRELFFQYIVNVANAICNQLLHCNHLSTMGKCTCTIWMQLELLKTLPLFFQNNWKIRRIA